MALGTHSGRDGGLGWGMLLPVWAGIEAKVPCLLKSRTLNSLHGYMKRRIPEERTWTEPGDFRALGPAPPFSLGTTVTAIPVLSPKQ